MTTTAAGLRRISVRFGTTTVDLAVPGGTRLSDLVVAGGFPPDARLIDASGAYLPGDVRAAEVLEDGDLIFVVDEVRSPELHRVAITGPVRTDAPAAGTTPAPVASSTSLSVDAAGAGGRRRSPATRLNRAAQTRTAPPPPPPLPTRTPAPARTTPPPPPPPPAAGSHRAPARSPARTTAAPAPRPPRPGARGTGRSGRGRPESPAEVPFAPGVVAGVLTLAVALVGAVLLTVAAGEDLPMWAGWTAGAALLVASLAGALREGSQPLDQAVRVGAAGCAAAGAFVLAVTLDLGTGVAAVAAFALGTAVAMLGRISAVRRGVFDPWTSVTASAFAVAGVTAAVSTVLDWPLYAGPLLLAGAGPLLLRALPGLSLEVPDEQLIDTERLSNTSWSARTGVRRRRRPLRNATVIQVTERAIGIVQSGTIALAIAAVVGYGLMVATPHRSDLAQWAGVAEGVLLFGAYGLAGRTVRNRRPKRVLRATAAVLTVGTGIGLHRVLGEDVLVDLVVVAAVLALLIIAVSIALAGGWSSLRLSRLADVAEGFCVVFALPAALIAVDAIEVFRQAAS